VDRQTPLGLGPLEFPIPTPRDLPEYAKGGHKYNSAMHGGVKCNMMHEHEHSTHFNS
jgi:hypothetical protein